MNPKDLIANGEYKHLNSKPQGDHKPASVMTLETTVDATPQKLNQIRPFFAMSGEISALLPAEAQITLQGIFSCFDQQKEVKEGLIGDLLWGFGECGIPPELTLRGLHYLEQAGYIKFQAPDNSYISAMSEHIGKAWVRYEKKLTDLVYSK